VFAWGDNESFQTDVPINLTGVVEIAATRFNSFALQGDGSVVPWGDTFPKVFNDASSLANVKAISVRGSHGLALLADGTVQAWGFNFAGVYDPPARADEREGCHGGRSQRFRTQSRPAACAASALYIQRIPAPQSTARPSSISARPGALTQSNGS